MKVPGEVLGHDKLEALDRVRRLLSSEEIDRHCRREAKHGHEGSLRLHAFDWETDSCQVEVSTEDFPTNSL